MPIGCSNGGAGAGTACGSAAIVLPVTVVSDVAPPTRTGCALEPRPAEVRRAPGKPDVRIATARIKVDGPVDVGALRTVLAALR
ncbi:hypothetical protein PSP31121_05387 [Pandoraea sputorum]|uniref:Uncharacterized protein n=1 Tax=Pandoraea sputorum TaxID=93222 RepID=A0A5E5BJ34_9BURK|nr:hypothetical protein PSP31121_05387 [Pandoraea sputorum]